MVPCFQQSNVYIKRKPQVCKFQKCILLIGAKTALICTGRQTTPSHVSQYRAEKSNLRETESTFRLCTVFAPRQCLYQKEATGMESPKCIPLVGAKTAPTCAGQQTTPSHVIQYRAENGNLRKSGSTFRNGTVFAPKICLHQNEATGMESPTMHSSGWCKNHTNLCGTAKYPISCKPV